MRNCIFNVQNIAKIESNDCHDKIILQNLKLQKVSDRDQQIKELTQKLKADGKDTPYFIFETQVKFCNVKFILMASKRFKTLFECQKKTPPMSEIYFWNPVTGRLTIMSI